MAVRKYARRKIGNNLAKGQPVSLVSLQNMDWMTLIQNSRSHHHTGQMLKKLILTDRENRANYKSLHRTRQGDTNKRKSQGSYADTSRSRMKTPEINSYVKTV